LDLYCKASGQRVNLEKSSVYFSKGVPNELREAVKFTLNVQSETLNEKYLGMPTDVGKSVNGVFKYLKDRVWKRVQGWIEMILSMAGKEVLIKSVAQALPTYSMGCFKLPRGLCEHIDKLLRQFWWGAKEGKRKTAWVSWNDMTQPKYMGGLGFRKMELFNLALLAKQGWRLIQEPLSLSAQILKAVYYPNDDFLSAQLGTRPSRIWRSILDGREVLKQGLIRRIGDGQSTHIWNDNWLPREAMMKPVTQLQPGPVMVSDLIDPVNRVWRNQVLTDHMLALDADTVRRIPLPTTVYADCWAWCHEKSGKFSVRSAYRMLIHTKKRREAWLDASSGTSDTRTEEKAWISMWKNEIPAKVKVFTWRLARQSLPTADVAHHRNMADDSTCTICGWGQDSWRHSLLDCRMARCVWVLVDEELYDKIRECVQPCARNWLFELDGQLPKDEYVKMLVTMWAIWKVKRDVMHEDFYQSPFATCKFITNYIQELGLVATQAPTRTGRAARPARRWIPPPSGSMKGNVDAAISVQKNVCAAAAIFRNEDGQFMGASALVMEGILDPACAEAIACREALCLAQDQGVSSVLIASDCLGVIQSILEGSLGENAMIIKEIADIRRSIPGAAFKHELRESNVDAHNLAKNSLDLIPGRHVWLLEPPGCVNRTIT
jgi:hypothetical protein